LHEEVFRFVVEEAKPKIISYAFGNPGALVKRAHDAGILFIQQVHTAKQAREEAELEVDAIIAKGQKGMVFVLV
jgi:enoyl-[acyl-carrier protein] reductase II